MKRKKTQEAVSTANGDNKMSVLEQSGSIAVSNGDAKSKGKKRRVVEK